MPEGTVFSIEEFATFDGPGIRMTVFLKGCPLRCMWCHNPEGQSFEPEFVRSPNGCTGCGACLRAGLAKTGKRTLCEESIAACPNHLVRRSGERYSPEALCGVIGRNARILNATGGGVTFSGGEPLSQPEFLLACLRRLEGKVHRAVQTSGFAGEETFRSVLAACDYMLYDLKLMDEAKHLHYTGQSNRQILQNFRILAASGREFCVRIPLIPSVNDTPENLEATAAFLRENGVGSVELLPYNKMAGGKYAMLGREYVTDFDGTAAPQPHPEIFDRYGIRSRVM